MSQSSKGGSKVKHHSSRPKRRKGSVTPSDILISAAIMGDLTKLTELVEDGLSVHSTNEEGNTPLHHCAEHGHLPMVKFLVEKNACVDTSNKSSTSPLHVAVVNGNADIVSFLIKNNANIDHQDIGGHTALHWAVTARKRKIMKILLKANANPNCVDNNGASPLHLAVGHEKEYIVQLLIKYKADIELKTNLDGHAPLHIACANNRAQIASLLLDKNANANTKDKSGDTPLHISCKRGSQNLVQLLLQAKANPSIRNDNGYFPREIATDKGIKEILRVKKVVLDDDWCIIEPEEGSSSVKKHRKVSVMEACDDEEKSNIVERFGQRHDNSFIHILDGAEAEVEAGLKKRNIREKVKIVDDNIVCPVIVRPQLNRPLIRKLGRFLQTKLNTSEPNLDVYIPASRLRQSAPVIPFSCPQSPATEHSEMHSRDIELKREIVSPYSNMDDDDEIDNTFVIEEQEEIIPELTRSLDIKSPLKSSNDFSDAFSGFQFSFGDPPPPKTGSPPKRTDLCKSMPNFQYKDSPDERLVKLLENLGLGKYIQTFLEEEWDWEALMEITAADLELMGLKSGSRRKLIAAISRVREEARQKFSPKSPTRLDSSHGNYIIDYSEITKKRSLGKGFYGEVFLGLWNGIEVAIKEMKQPLCVSVDKWLLEIELLNKIRHPNIISFYCASIDEPHYCIVLEFAARGSLEKILSDPIVEITNRRRLKFLCDIARGVKYLHSQNPPIIHRDLKSDNVLIDENWVAKVSDFGLSRYKDETYSYGKASTPFDVTINPAEVLRDNHISEKADVYSFALMMWELYTRKRPFKGMNPRWVAQQVIEYGVRPSLDDTENWDPAYVQLMVKCWDENHTLRPSFDEILLHLENMLETEIKNTPVTGTYLTTF